MTNIDLLARIKDADDSYQSDVLSKNLALGNAESFSKQMLDKIRDKIREQTRPGCIHALAMAGSLARHEASSQSDLDLIVTTKFEVSEKSEEFCQLTKWRDRLCEDLKMEKPNPKGVFIAPIHHQRLATSAGSADEPYQDVSKRVLLLLESTWLDAPEPYNDLINKIISKYAEDVVKDGRKNFVFLLNDVVRFFRAICVNYQYTKSETEDGKWPLRNIKLRHSRVVMYFSLIAAIGLLSKVHDEQKVPALTHLIKMTPLRRLSVVYTLSEDGAFFKVAQFYNQFLSLLGDDAVRRELKNLEYDDRYKSNWFAQLKANSDGLSSELLRFFEARRRQWDDRFFEYMIL